MTDLGRVLIAAAERNPGALAVVDGAQRFDYAAWLDTAARLATGLGGLGLARGDRLAVIMQNRWQMAALHWACQLAGVVVVPINWRSNAEELDYFLEDSGAAALAFDESAAAAVAGSACAARLRRVGVGDAPGGTVGVMPLYHAMARTFGSNVLIQGCLFPPDPARERGIGPRFRPGCNRPQEEIPWQRFASTNAVSTNSSRASPPTTFATEN